MQIQATGPRILSEPREFTCRVCKRPSRSTAEKQNVCNDCVASSRLLQAEQLRELRLQEAMDRLRRMGLSGDLLEMSLANFDPAPQPRAWRAVLDFAKAWPKEFRNLALLGVSGCGKTHLAVGLARLALERGQAGLYACWPEVWRLIDKAEKRSEAEEKYLDPCFYADLLVIDDAGRESGTSYKDNWLDVIINARYRERQATIITANLKEEELSSWLGGASQSRFLSVGEVVVLEPKDMRGQPRKVAHVTDLQRDPTVPCDLCKGAGWVTDVNKPLGSKKRCLKCPKCGGQGY